MLVIQAGVQRPHGFDHSQASMNCALRVVFVRVRIAEVHQEAISQILGDVPGKLLDHRGTGGLIRTHDLAEVFGVELAGKGQNSTVSWRRSASDCREGVEGATRGVGGVLRVDGMASVSG